MHVMPYPSAAKSVKVPRNPQSSRMMITHRFSSNVLHTDVAAACVDQSFSSLFLCVHISNLTILQDMSALLPS